MRVYLCIRYFFQGDIMGNKGWKRRQGRIVHDLMLYKMVMTQASINAPTINDPDWQNGWDSGSTTIQKTIMRNLFESNVTGSTINVGNFPFTFFYNNTPYWFPGGVVKKIEGGCFPYYSTVVIHTPRGDEIRECIGSLYPEEFGCRK